MFLLDNPDANQISEYADEGMHWMVMNKIMVGMPDGTLSPKGSLTRAQLATMICRYADIIEE